MTNPTRGTVTHEIDGIPYTMRLDWNAVAEIREKFPDGYNLTNPSHLSVVMAVAMAGRHPDMTPERIMEMSPPLAPAIEAVTDAINYCWFGAKDPPAKVEDPGNPPGTAGKTA
jgi:hypothetical protein